MENNVNEQERVLISEAGGFCLQICLDVSNKEVLSVSSMETVILHGTPGYIYGKVSKELNHSIEMKKIMVLPYCESVCVVEKIEI